MKNFIAKSTVTAVIGLGLLSSCSPESKTLGITPVQPENKFEIPKNPTIPEQQFGWITEDGGQSNQEFNPKIDILFVIDNSDSMVSAQANLKRNIDKFTAGIIKNKMIDYHIGVISTWDSSERAAKLKKDGYGIGELRHVTTPNGQKLSQRYLDRSMEDKNLIASTLHIGVTPFEQGGPENEEFFAPLQAALEKGAHALPNEGFFRDEAQLVIVLLTDADESAPRISAEQMTQSLVDFKKAQASKISVYAALVSANDPDQFKDWALRIHPKYHPDCFSIVGKTTKNNGTCKTGFGPKILEQFVRSANSQSGKTEELRKNFIMSIRQDFGNDLSRIGNDIVVKTLEKDIFLSQRPRVDRKTNQLMLRVRYGTSAELQAGQGQTIPAGQTGWLYNAEENLVHLSGKIQYKYVQGGRFAVDLQPVSLKL